MSPRLLHVLNDSAFFLSHRLQLALAARKAGLDVHIATPRSAASAVIEGHGLPYHPYPLSRSGTSPVGEARSLAALARLYREVRPDIVHHTTIKPVIYGSLAARLTGVPAVVNAVTGLGYVFIANGRAARTLRLAVKGAYRLALRHPRLRVVFQNPDDRALFVDGGLVAPAVTTLIKGVGVNVGQFSPHPEPEGAPVVVLASRMLRDKGVGEYVEAARRLRGAGVVARFVLVGPTDPDNPACVPEAELRAWQAEGAVEWWGERKDMPDVFARCHIACLPSYREGLPKVLLEAAASGRPIVATDVPGCREIVRHEENGLLATVRDADSLARALRRLIEDAPLRARLGARGREMAVEEFSEERINRQMLAVYEELLA